MTDNYVAVRKERRICRNCSNTAKFCHSSSTNQNKQATDANAKGRNRLSQKLFKGRAKVSLISLVEGGTLCLQVHCKG